MLTNHAKYIKTMYNSGYNHHEIAHSLVRELKLYGVTMTLNEAIEVVAAEILKMMMIRRDAT